MTRALRLRRFPRAGLAALVVARLALATATARAAPDDTHAQVRDGTRVGFPPMVIPQDKPAVDRRPVLIGAGLVVLALVFAWNRRRRDRFEHQDDAKDDDA